MDLATPSSFQNFISVLRLIELLNLLLEHGENAAQFAELQGPSLSATGCMKRSFFVRCLYVFKALSILSRKLDDAEVGCV